MICSTFMENWPNRNTIDTNLIQTWSRLCQIILNAWILYINKNNLKFKNVSTSVLSATWHSTSTPQQQRFEMLGHGISTTKRPRWRWSPRLWWRRLSLLDYSCREWSSAEDEERKAKFTRGQHPTQLQGDWVDGANPPSPTMSQNPRRRMCIPIRGMCNVSLLTKYVVETKKDVFISYKQDHLIKNDDDKMILRETSFLE